MPKVEVFDIKAIGRSRKVVETRRAHYWSHAEQEYSLMKYLYPKCDIIIEQKEVFIREIEKKTKLPKTQKDIENKEASVIFHLG